MLCRCAGFVVIGGMSAILKEVNEILAVFYYIFGLICVKFGTGALHRSVSGYSGLRENRSGGEPYFSWVRKLISAGAVHICSRIWMKICI